MLNSRLEILCGPVLIAQGLYSKWKIPRLPEPTGVRAGQIGQGPALKLLITGDSAAAGVGAEDQKQALSGQLIAQLQQNFDCTWYLHAQSGLTSMQLIEFLNQLPTEKFDVVVVSVGVNDVLQPRALAGWSKRMQTLHQLLIEKFSVQYVIYSAVPPMHQFKSLPNPLRYFLGQTAQQMNTQLEQLFSRSLNSTVLHLPLNVEAKCIAQDGFHPSPYTYQVWASALTQLIENRLTMQQSNNSL